MQELSAREDVKAVSVTEDRKMLRVESVDGDYKPIMYYAVNVVSRDSRRLSFPSIISIPRNWRRH